MAKKVILSVLLLCLAAYATSARGDSFDQIKQSMAEAGCNLFEFLSIVESDIFDVVDTTVGRAVIARDGRYSIEIGTDHYLYDLEFLYNYSRVHNQVTVERPNPDLILGEEVSFITRLDEFYRSFVVESEREYRLVKSLPERENIPDSMRLFIAVGPPRLVRLEYLDTNEELNMIVFLSQTVLPECEDGSFTLDLPDSVETVRLH